MMKRLLIGCVRCYQIVISPFFAPTCRYYPTCSRYAIESIARHGALKGGWLSLRRILRCSPWGGSGVDLVPPSVVKPAHQTKTKEL